MTKVRTTLAALALAALTGATAQAGDVNIKVNVGAPTIPVIVPAPPVPIIVPEPPLFLVPPHLGFRVAVEVPYDMVFIDGRYFVCHEDRWYVGPHYNGPWTGVGHDRLPPGLRKFKLSRIRGDRDEEYRHYRKDKDRYRGEHYRPNHDRDRDHDHDRDHDRDDNDRHEKRGKGKEKKHKHDD